MAYFSNGKLQGTGGVEVETGTFTPTLQDSSFSDAEGQTYSLQDGRYAKIGNRIFVEFRIVMTSLGTLNGANAANIAGFPFPIVGDVSTLVLGQAVGLSVAGSSTPVTGRMDSATQTMRPMAMVSVAGHSSLLINQITFDGDMKFSGHYRTN